jgi:hemoglobin/transferrin/lactoferrin receptor protein
LTVVRGLFKTKKMKKHLIALILLWSMSNITTAQVIKIVDNLTRQPIEQAVILNEKNNFTATTNIKGEADITCCANRDTLVFRVLGYELKMLTVDEIAATNFIVHLTPEPFSLNEIIVSGNRWQQDAREIPSKVTVIKKSNVLLQNPQTAADLLGVSGEVFIQKSQMGGGSPMIRGFAANRLLITVDGVRMNNAIFRSGNLQNVISLDALSTERTEVIFGPGSVIYGSDAIAGVMSFYTLQPSLAVEKNNPIVKGSALGRYSSANNEKTGHFDVSVGGRKFGATTSFTYYDFDDLLMGSRGPDKYLRRQYVQRIDSTDVLVDNPNPRRQVPTGYNQINLMQKLRYKPCKTWDINYGFHYSATSDYSRYDRLIRPHENTLHSAEWYYGPQIWLMSNLDLLHSGANVVYDKMRINVAYQYFQESRVDRDLNKSTRRMNKDEVDAISVNLDFEKNVRTKHRFNYGLEYVYNKVGSFGEAENILTGDSIGFASRYPDGSTWSSYAAFLTYRFKVNEKLILHGGLRYNQFVLNSEFDTTFFNFPFTKANINAGAVTGSAGVVFNPTETWQIGANFSTGFRSPNVDDIGKVFDSTPGSVVVPNPGLKSEYAYNAELAVAKIFGKWVKVDVTGYYTLLQNALVRRPYQLIGQDSIEYAGELSRVEAVQNAAKAYVYGVQAGIEINLPEGFGLTSRFNWQKGREELDDKTTAPLRHAGPWFGSSHFTFTRSKLKLDFYVLYNGEIKNKDLAPTEADKDYIYAADANDNPYSPAWFTINFKAMYQLNEHFMLSAGIENITDERYLPYSSGIVAPGRNFILSARVVF